MSSLLFIHLKTWKLSILLVETIVPRKKTEHQHVTNKQINFIHLVYNTAKYRVGLTLFLAV